MAFGIDFGGGAGQSFLQGRQQAIQEGQVAFNILQQRRNYELQQTNSELNKRRVDLAEKQQQRSFGLNKRRVELAERRSEQESLIKNFELALENVLQPEFRKLDQARAGGAENDDEYVALNEKFKKQFPFIDEIPGLKGWSYGPGADGVPSISSDFTITDDEEIQNMKDLGVPQPKIGDIYRISRKPNGETSYEQVDKLGRRLTEAKINKLEADAAGGKRGVKEFTSNKVADIFMAQQRLHGDEEAGPRTRAIIAELHKDSIWLDMGDEELARKAGVPVKGQGKVDVQAERKREVYYQAALEHARTAPTEESAIKSINENRDVLEANGVDVDQLKNEFRDNLVNKQTKTAVQDALKADPAEAIQSIIDNEKELIDSEVDINLLIKTITDTNSFRSLDINQKTELIKLIQGLEKRLERKGLAEIFSTADKLRGESSRQDLVKFGLASPGTVNE